ncbi:MAG: DUF308 domain-containing protein [Clostridiales bacterium]|nr:DUF308 domain-containing protein [Clostridiales bacterium]MCC8106041.1 DUF308 domain-containing protein [Clostridiales bacterium]
MDSLRTLKIARTGYIIIALITCVLGISLLINPVYPIHYLCTALGLIFIADGIIKIIGYFSKDLYCLAFQYDFAFGILLATVGLLILIRGETYSRLLFSILGLILLADALFRIQMSIDAKKFGLNPWWRIFLAAVITGVFGMILVVNPYDGAGYTMVFTGFAFLFDGLLNLCVAIYAVKILDCFSDRLSAK